MVVDGTRQTTTFTRTVIVGSAHTISAPSPQTHLISAPVSATSYTARFRKS
jgi:hypothetical protein